MFIDADVVPSFLGLQSESSNGDINDNYFVRIGEVQDVVYPNDPKSRTKKFIEYSVLCEHKNNNCTVIKLYEHCLMMSTFGGLADWITFSLRPENHMNNITPCTIPGATYGSKVLIVCVNGEGLYPVIIGGLRHFLDSDMFAIPTQDLALVPPPGPTAPGTSKTIPTFLHGVFNGLDFIVNNSGELIVTYGGATDRMGLPQAPNPGPGVTGTTLKFAVDGSWSVVSGPGDQSFKIDNLLKKIDFTAATQFNVTLAPTGQFNLTVPQGPVTISSGTVTIGATSGVSMSGGAGGVSLGNNPIEAALNATTYRVAETALNNAIIGILGPWAAGVIASAPVTPQQLSAAILALAGAITGVLSVLATFEAGSSTYLSTDVKTSP